MFVISLYFTSGKADSMELGDGDDDDDDDFKPSGRKSASGQVC